MSNVSGSANTAGSRFASAKRDGHERSGGEDHVAVLDVAAGESSGTANCAEVTHRFLDGTRRELWPLGEQRPLVGMLGEQGHRTTELVASRVGATDDHGVDHHHELVVGQLVAGLFGSDQVGQQIVRRLAASFGDQAAGVLAELVLRPHDQFELVDDIGREDLEDVAGPAAEELPVLLRRARAARR